MGILSTLHTLVEYFTYGWEIFSRIFNMFLLFVPPVISGITSVVSRIYSAVPLSLTVVALLCVTCMILRFAWNAIRGSGA